MIPTCLVCSGHLSATSAGMTKNPHQQCPGATVDGRILQISVSINVDGCLLRDRLWHGHGGGGLSVQAFLSDPRSTFRCRNRSKDHVSRYVERSTDCSRNVVDACDGSRVCWDTSTKVSAKNRAVASSIKSLKSSLRCVVFALGDTLQLRPRHAARQEALHGSYTRQRCHEATIEELDTNPGQQIPLE